jgi:hypothetical protein
MRIIQHTSMVGVPMRIALRPSTDVIEALPPIAGDRHGVLRCYSQIDAGDVMSLERERAENV